MSTTDAPILVTGATGFIGSAVVAGLADAGAVVRASGRRRPSARDVSGRPLPADRVDRVVADVCDALGLRAAMRGCRAVVHCAAGDGRDTVVGTRTVLEAAAAPNPVPVVHLSSIAVYGGRRGSVPETTPLPRSGLGGYARAKIAAEQACWQSAQDGGRVTVLRPSIVYGPGSRLWIEKMAHRLKANVWGRFDRVGTGTCNLVYVDDVVQAIRLSLEHPEHAGRAFNVNGPESPTWNDFFERLNAALGRPPVRQIGPVALAGRVLASLPAKVVARAIPHLRPRLGAALLAPAPGELTLFRLTATYPIAAAREHLGYAPRVGVDDGLARSVAWLRSIGLNGEE